MFNFKKKKNRNPDLFDIDIVVSKNGEELYNFTQTYENQDQIKNHWTDDHYVLQTLNSFCRSVKGDISEHSYNQRPLTEIWERECYRLSEEPVKVTYCAADNSIRYRDESGILTAVLSPEAGEEKLYFRDANALEGSEYGIEIAYIKDNGKIHGDTISASTGKSAIDDTNISDALNCVVTDWQFDRDIIGVEDTGTIPMPTKADRSDYYEAKNDFAEFRKFLAEQNNN